VLFILEIQKTIARPRQTTKKTEIMTAVLAARDQTIIGYAYWIFTIAHCGGLGPEFTRQHYNPREATVESLKNLDRQIAAQSGFQKDRLEWAMTMGVRRSWIKNLDQISRIRPGNVGPIPDIEWTAEAKDGIADLFNGNHCYRLIKNSVADLPAEQNKLKDRIRVGRSATTKKEIAQKLKDVKRMEKINKMLIANGRFVVELIDLGE
jgi:hypothetical protein